MTFLRYLPKVISILRFMLELTPLIQRAEKLIPQPGQGGKKKSLIMGLLKKVVGFLGDGNIIKEDQADLGGALIDLADQTIDAVVDVLNETGGFEEVGD